MLGCNFSLIADLVVIVGFAILHLAKRSCYPNQAEGMGFDADMRTNKGKKTRERGGDHSINL